MYDVDNLVLEDRQYTEVGQITCMDDSITSRKGMVAGVDKPLFRGFKVGVREDTYLKAGFGVHRLNYYSRRICLRMKKRTDL